MKNNKSFARIRSGLFARKLAAVGKELGIPVSSKNYDLGRGGSLKMGKGGVRQVGVVKWFSNQKGYGFITPEAGGKDVFVHHSAIRGEGYKSLEEGQQVEFEVTNGPKGEQASGVVKL